MDEEKPAENECTCNCDCECCRRAKSKPKPSRGSNSPQDSNNPITHFSANDTVGAAFLGIMAMMLLVFLVRSNKRNRELLLEVINLRRQA